MRGNEHIWLVCLGVLLLVLMIEFFPIMAVIDVFISRQACYIYKAGGPTYTVQANWWCNGVRSDAR